MSQNFTRLRIKFVPCEAETSEIECASEEEVVNFIQTRQPGVSIFQAGNYIAFEEYGNPLKKTLIGIGPDAIAL